MKTIFKKRYVLGIGFPWAMGTDNYKEIALSEQVLGISLITLDFPNELWSQKIPKYRLVLERIDEEE